MASPLSAWTEAGSKVSIFYVVYFFTGIILGGGVVQYVIIVFAFKHHVHFKVLNSVFTTENIY